MRKLKIIIPVLMLACIAIWWFTPHFSDEDKAYYIAVYCLKPGQNDAQALQRIERMIEGNNQDYALKKRHYQAKLAEHTLEAWHSLDTEQAKQAHQTTDCRRLLAQKMVISPLDS